MRPMTRHSMPVSSRTSLITASSAVSPISTKPAGKDHFPFKPPYLFFTTSHCPSFDFTNPATANQTLPRFSRLFIQTPPYRDYYSIISKRDRFLCPLGKQFLKNVKLSFF